MSVYPPAQETSSLSWESLPAAQQRQLRQQLARLLRQYLLAQQPAASPVVSQEASDEPAESHP
jgi:hypothetical protein